MVAAADHDGDVFRVADVSTTYELARVALETATTLDAVVAVRLTGERVDLARAEQESRLLAPIDHPDSAHLYLTGTGLTHLGSAEERDKMHTAAASGHITDSMRMFMMGLEGGKPDGSMAARNRRSPGSTSSTQRVIRGASDSAWPTSFPITSPNAATTCGWRIPSCAPLHWARSC
jgi:hypothetical protein